MAYTNDFKQTRKIVLHLPARQARFLDQELTRLREKTGKRFTITELIQVLVEQHRTRMELKAEADPEGIAWMYRRLAERTG